MTVFATADGSPFYCGTYFPREHFQRLLVGVSEAWRNERENVVDQGRQIVEALQLAGMPATSGLPDGAALDAAVARLRDDYDPLNGGFGGSPKFPPGMVIEFLLRNHARHEGQGETARNALQMAAGTAEAMARGGMYDQLAGGFARYSVDARWVVPHFEKMLYDNALLVRAYTRLWSRTSDPLARRVAEETAQWMVDELGTGEGGFASAIDADSEGEEGRYYVWTPDELHEVLGEEDAAWAAEVFEVTAIGTFEHGASVLQLREDPDDAERLARVRSALYERRSHRVRPERDDKVVAAWNGLAIGALAEAGVVFERPDLVQAARRAAELLTGLHLVEGRLWRTSRAGSLGAGAGVLEDYACVADGLLALHAATGEARWVSVARGLLDVVCERFADDRGGFYDTADDAEALFTRPQDPTDNATPSGQFAAAGALLACASLTGDSRFRDAALSALSPVGLLAERAPRFAGWGMAVAEAALAGPVQVAVVGSGAPEDRARLLRSAMTAPSPGAVVSLGDGEDDGGVPLLQGRTMVEGRPAAYVCRDFACRLPVTSPAELRASLAV
jgi:uncharacterized protein